MNLAGGSECASAEPFIAGFYESRAPAGRRRTKGELIQQNLSRRIRSGTAEGNGDAVRCDAMRCDGPSDGRRMDGWMDGLVESARYRLTE